MDGNEYLEVDEDNYILNKEKNLYMGYFRKCKEDIDPKEVTRKPSFWKRLWHTFF